MDQHFAARVGILPQFFGDEGHDRVQHGQTLIQNPFQGLARFRGLWCIVLQQGFGQFHVPVADLAPDKRIKRVGGIVEPVVFQGCVDFFADAGGFADDPFVQGVVHIRVAGVGR